MIESLLKMVTAITVFTLALVPVAFMLGVSISILAWVFNLGWKVVPWV